MTLVLARVCSLVIGLIFGLFQTAFIIGKSKGIDIRNYGSGNSGTTNALRVLGTKIGLLVLLGDALKTIIAMMIVRFTFGRMYPDYCVMLTMYAGLGCVLSHDFPVYMKFKGGKGIACTAGLCISLAFFNPLYFILGVIAFFVPWLITHYVSLGSLLVYLGFMIEMIVFGNNGWIWLGDHVVDEKSLIEIYIISAILTFLAYFLHRANIVRLVTGKERKTFLSKKKKEEYAALQAANENSEAK